MDPTSVPPIPFAAWRRNLELLIIQNADITTQTETARHGAVRTKTRPGVHVSAAPRAGWWPHLAHALILVGAAIRFQQFFVRRSLWLDEALLANNVVGRGYGQLLEPLGGNQAAPPGFLWIERAAMSLFGTNEYALRLLPLAAGIALPWLIWLLARRVLTPVSAVVATGLVAFSPPLIRYSTEVKQYGTDAGVAVALAALGIPLLREPTRLRAAAFGAVGVGAVWLSHTAIFVLAAMGATAVVMAAQRRDWRHARLVVGALLPCAISFAVLFWSSLRLVQENSALSEYWSAGYPTSVAALPTWGWRTTRDFVDQLGGFTLFLPVTVLAAIGFVNVWKRSREVATWFLALIGLVVVASTVRLFPASGRLILFLLPIFLMCLAASLICARPAVAPAAVLLAVCVGAPMWATVRTVMDPPLFADSRPVFEYARRHLRPGDEIIVHDVTKAPFDFYAPTLGLSAIAQSQWSRDCTGVPQLRDALEQVGVQRVWVLFAYTLSTRPANESMLVQQAFDRVATRIDHVDRADASATLYELEASGGTHRDSSEGGAARCLRLNVLRSADP